MIKYQYENKMTSWGYLAMAIGPMRAGKTQWLFHHLTQCADLNRTVLYIGYASDNRTDVNSCNHGITTHSSGGVILSPAITRVKTSYLNELDVIKYDVIGIDEAQFYSDLIPSVTKWLHQGKRIYVAGLDGDYEMKPIGSVLSLIPLATMVTKLTAYCTYCLAPNVAMAFTPAPYTRRIISVDSQIYIGGDDAYVSVCGDHHCS